MKLTSILWAVAAALVSIGLTGCASSQTSSSRSDAAHPSAKAVKKVDFLFVQTAKGFSHENGRITLRGVNPLTISFSDRPDRIAGHMPTSKFIPMWSQGADSQEISETIVAAVSTVITAHAINEDSLLERVIGLQTTQTYDPRLRRYRH